MRRGMANVAEDGRGVVDNSPFVDGIVYTRHGSRGLRALARLLVGSGRLALYGGRRFDFHDGPFEPIVHAFGPALRILRYGVLF